jgi:hypothetical protein
VNTEMAALYLDILLATYNDESLVLAEYNGGPLNAGYLRAGSRRLAAETEAYVPKVLATYDDLKQSFETGSPPHLQAMHRDLARTGKRLGEPLRPAPESDEKPAILGAP